MRNLFLAAFIILSSSLFAQKGFHLGVIAGPQFTAQLNQQDFDNPDIGWNGPTVRAGYGVAFNYHFTDKIGLGTQVFFSYQGMKYKDRSGIDYFRKTNYMKIPILFHVNSTPQKLVGGYFYIGPQVSLLLYNDLKALGVSLKKNIGGIDYNIYSALHKKYTIGGVMGFGIVFNILKGRLQANLGLRLDGDFTDTYKGKDLVAVPVGNAFDPFDATGNLPVDPSTGKRSPTHSVAGMIEIGVKYVFIKK